MSSILIGNKCSKYIRWYYLMVTDCLCERYRLLNIFVNNKMLFMY